MDPCPNCGAMLPSKDERKDSDMGPISDSELPSVKEKASLISIPKRPNKSKESSPIAMPLAAPKDSEGQFQEDSQ